MNKIKKVKLEANKIRIEYLVPVLTADNPDDDEHSLLCAHRARPSFYEALEALAPFVAEICEQPKEWAGTVEVKGISFSYGGINKASDAKKWCEESARQRIDYLEMRAKYKLATEKQLRMMVDTLGFNAKKAGRLKKWEASTAIEHRMLEMAGDIESTGLSGRTFEELKAMKPWELAPLYKRFCGTVDGGEP